MKLNYLLTIMFAFVLLSLTALSTPPNHAASASATINVNCNGLHMIYPWNPTALPVGSVTAGGNGLAYTPINSSGTTLDYRVFGEGNVPMDVTIDQWDEQVDPDGLGAKVYCHSWLKIGNGHVQLKPGSSFRITPDGTNGVSCLNTEVFQVIPFEASADLTCKPNNAVIFRFTFSVIE